MNAARGNFKRACDRFLNARNGYDYDVEYSCAVTVDGSTPWTGLSAIDLFV